jgi:chemotaxis protein histidine kinase CheA
MSNEFDKFAILESFLDEVASYLPEIEAHLDRLQQTPGDQELLAETYRRAHTIAGSAAMMDFTDLAHVAQGMEEILGDVIDRGAPLDPPTVALLRRSSSRLGKLMEQARAGTDGTQLVAEDDADRAASRGGSSGGLRSPNGSVPGAPGSISTPPGQPSSSGVFARSAPAAGAPPPASAAQLPDWLVAFGGGQPGSPSGSGPVPQAGPAPTMEGTPAGQPSFDEMVQAFRTNVPDAPQVPTAPPAATPWTGASSAPSAPGASSRPGARSAPPSAAASRSGDVAVQRTAPVPAVGTAGASAPSWPAASASSVGGSTAPQPTQPPAGHDDIAQSLVAISPAWEDLQVTEGAVQRQVAALRDVVATLHEAAHAMEDERAELRSFLDGSKDALDRLEEWAGLAMGLDLRQSPEHVRRYLPLSVIWVTTTRLKKLVALLNNSGRRLTASQEDINEALKEMHISIENIGRLFSAVAAAASATGATAPDGSFRATVAQVTHVAFAPPPAPTIDAAASAPASASGETFIVARRATGPAELPPGARAELERSVREELRRQLEDEVRGEIAAEVRSEEESRIRHELEIQVRRQILAELTPGLGASRLAGADRSGEGPIIPPLASPRERAPRAVRVTDQSPEALDVFREEAEEHLQHIAMGIRQLEENPGDVEALQSVRRATHTLKGAAGMMGFEPIQQLAHASEDLLDRLVDGAITLSPDVQGLLLDTSEALERLAAGTAGPADEQERMLQTLQRRYDALLGRARALPEDPAFVMSEMPASAPQHPGAAPAADGDGADADLSVRLRLSKLDELINLFGDLLQNRSILDERVTRLGRMIADVSIVSQRLGEVGTQLETRFEAATLPSGRRAGQPDGQAAMRGPMGGIRDGRNGNTADASHLSEFDELELDRYNEFHRLSRGLSESVADMATLSSEMETLVREVEAIFGRETRLSSVFQDRLMKARLVPLQTLVPRLYRAARAAALRQGKETEFFVEGGSTEVDRTVHEEIAGPLLHIVRNAVVHGIERPEVRERAGKPRAGRIYLSASEVGNQVVITVRDDGAGVDLEKVRTAALARGMIDTFTRLTPAETLDLMFQPGLSTADSIDEESGRGVGLDVVRDAVARLRGTVEVESTPGLGTTFTLRIPVSLQILRAVLVKAGPQLFAIPMSVVEQIGRLDYYERTRGDGPPAVEVRGNRYPLAHLASYLNLPPGPVDEKSPVLLFNAGRQRTALLLDGIPGRQEVVVKSLGPHLRDVRGVTGATVLGDGRVVLILNLPEVLAVPPRSGVALPAIPAPSGSAARMPTGGPASSRARTPDKEAIARMATGAPAPSVLGEGTGTASASITARSTSTQPTIRVPAPAAAMTERPATGQLRRLGYALVVDDSPSVRRVVSNMLKANGWEVQTARDGIEALDIIAQQRPAAVLLDIEMPRMDGYELIAAIRSQSQYKNLPLVVLTSRAAAKHHQRAMQLGADEYVVKPYQDEELIRTLDNLVAAHAGR